MLALVGPECDKTKTKVLTFFELWLAPTLPHSLSPPFSLPLSPPFVLPPLSLFPLPSSSLLQPLPPASPSARLSFFPSSLSLIHSLRSPRILLPKELYRNSITALSSASGLNRFKIQFRLADKKRQPQVTPQTPQRQALDNDDHSAQPVKNHLGFPGGLRRARTPQIWFSLGFVCWFSFVLFLPESTLLIRLEEAPCRSLSMRPQVSY